MIPMAAVPVPVTEREIDDRRRLGIDKHDECWAGEWHLVNPPKLWHDDLNVDLFLALVPRAQALGLRPHNGPVGLFAADNDWRVPDQIYFRPEDAREEGVVSAELVVEIRSPGDDSYKKMSFYASRGVSELMIIHQDRRFELYWQNGQGHLVPVWPDDDGVVRSGVLGVAFTTVEGPKLRVEWDGGAAEV
jgi:Uma2 family endonuclease